MKTPPKPQPKTNGAERVDVEHLPSASKLAADLGISVRTISRLQAAGHVRRWEALDGTWRYDPEQVAAAVNANTTQEVAAEGAKIVLDGSADTLRQALALLQQAHGQIATQAAPAQLLLELLAAENRRLSEQNAELLKTHLELVKAREQALSEQHARDIAAATLSSQEARKDKVFAGLARVAPRLLKQFETSLGGGPQVAAAVSLMRSLERNQLEVLLASDFVTDAQKEYLRVVLEHTGSVGESAEEEHGEA